MRLSRPEVIVAVVIILLVFVESAHAVNSSAIVDTIFGKYQNAGQAWVGALKNAAGTAKAIYPGDLITLSMQVFQNTLQHVNFLQPESIVAPIVIALIILIVCALIAVNMMLLLCAAWVVVYAGLIFLGFGGCRWTSDMAINYYRTVLGVGVSLMTSREEEVTR